MEYHDGCRCAFFDRTTGFELVFAIIENGLLDSFEKFSVK